MSRPWASPAPVGVTLAGIARVFTETRTGHRRRVLDGFDLRIEPGELVCLVGPSGCGKSTLLNIVAGLDRPDAGTVRIDRPGSAAPSDEPARIGYVFQKPNLLDWVSVTDNLALATRAAGVDTDVGALLADVGLADHAHAWPTTLSGGQRQRVAVARAFAVEPDLLLADEPFSALDELTARHLRTLLQRLWSQRPRTGIFVTHNTLEAALLADRIVVLSDGPARIVADLRVDLPRPRHAEDPDVFAVHRAVGAALGAAGSSGATVPG